MRPASNSAILLGIDLGTSGVKGLALDENGSILASAYDSYPMLEPQAGWVEQDSADWWRSVVHVIRQILQNPAVDPANIRALSLSGQMHGSVFLDSKRRVIRNPILWNDTRTSRQCTQITKLFGEEHLINLVGNPALEGFTAPKVLWLRDNEPRNFARLRTLLLPKDYIVYRLTGRLCTEVSDAAGTLLLDVANRIWSQEISSALELDPAILPEVLESIDVVGNLTSKAAEETGLPTTVMVIGGGADNACSAVGNGVVAEGIVLVSLGSSGVVLAHTNDMHHDPKGRIHSFNHSVPHCWYLMGVMLSAGMSISWLKNNLVGRDYEYLNEQASQVPSGSAGVIFLPYLYGERTPHRNPDARGVFFGLSGIHSREHLIRAVFEGVAFGLKDSLELIKNLAVVPDEIRITGGGARSKLWLQILADVFDHEVTTMNADEGPAFGAALLAAVGAGIFSDLGQAVEKCVAIKDHVTPNREDVTRYQSIYPLFKSLYQSLESDFAESRATF